MAFSLPNKQSQTMSNIKIENSIIASIVYSANGFTKVYVRDSIMREDRAFTVRNDCPLLREVYWAMESQNHVSIELEEIENGNEFISVYHILSIDPRKQ